MTDLDLLKIPRAGGEELRLTLAEYKGSRFLNLRVWFNAGGGEMRPGKQGVTVPLWAIEEMCRALGQAQAIALGEKPPREANRGRTRH